MSAIGDFVATGPAEFRRVRTAALVDFTAALVLAMLAFPFPIARASLPQLVFVGSILASIVIVHVAYLAVVLFIWGRTPGMYLLDIGLEDGRPGMQTALMWGLGASLAFWPTVLSAGLGHPETGLPARISGRRTLSTAPAASVKTDV